MAEKPYDEERMIWKEMTMTNSIMERGFLEGKT